MSHILSLASVWVERVQLWFQKLQGSDSVHLSLHSTDNKSAKERDANILHIQKKLTDTYIQAVLLPPQHHCCFWTQLCLLLWQQCCSLCQEWGQSVWLSPHSLTNFLCHGRNYYSFWYQCRTPVGRTHRIYIAWVIVKEKINTSAS